jgi:hypothetical protein
MMAVAAMVGFVWLGFIVLAGYLFAQLLVLALEMLSNVMEELR